MKTVKDMVIEDRQILLCTDVQPLPVKEISDLINICVEAGLKAKVADALLEFDWKDDDGKPITINNYRQNKVIMVFEKA